MDCISPFIEPIMSCLWDPIKKETSYLIKAESNIENMAISMLDLKACRDDLQKEIEDAEREQKQGTNVVKSWLQKEGDIQVQVDMTKTKYESRGCRLFGDCSLNCWSTYKLGKEAAMLHDKVEQLQTQRANFSSVATMLPPGHNIAIPTEPSPRGLDRYVEIVRNYLTGNDVGVIGIYGMGGVGKTTLLEEINNSLLGENNLGFEYQIWVVVSKEFQLTTVQARVAEKLKLQLNDKDDAKQNALDIFNYLKDKDFLLMLDDVWEGFDIVKDVGIPDTHCGNSSNNQTKRRRKVILTSRSERVCGRMGAAKRIKVECLDRLDARKLFKETFGERDLEANPGIHRLVDEVADECAGLPLALVVIAKAMSTRITIEEWQQAIESLKELSKEGKLLYEDLHLFPTLKFSYDSLKSDVLKKCFLYCSLWPEDRNIEKNEIIAFCIGIELVKDFDTITKAFDKGHLLIEELKGACLLESGYDQSFVKMHDVLRDLAMWIASDDGKNQNKWLVKAGIGLREVQLEAGKWKEAQAVSLMDNLIEEVPPVPFECPNITFLMLQNNPNLHKIDPSIFQNMCALTSLSLRGTVLRELPESISMLTMLLYLDLSDTYLRSLPKGLGKLTRLRYLGLQGMNHLKCIPAGVISSLVELQVFDLRWAIAAVEISIRGPEADENNGEPSEEVSSEERSLIDEVGKLPGGLKGFGVCLFSAEAFQRLSRLSRVFTWHLQLSKVEGMIHLQRNMWSSLESLLLRECDDAMELVFVADEGRTNDTCPIKELNIFFLREFREIIIRGVVPSVFFQRLQKVDILACGRLKNINWILGLQSLACLLLNGCSGMECLVDDLPGKEDADEAFDFPTLTRLELIYLPKLCCICRPIPRINFPTLESLYVWRCPNLKKFPFPTSNDKLKIKCDREWWDGLEVEESIKNSLQPSFEAET